MTIKTWIKHLEFLRDYALKNAEEYVGDPKGHIFFMEYIIMKRILESKDLYLK